MCFFVPQPFWLTQKSEALCEALTVAILAHSKKHLKVPVAAPMVKTLEALCKFCGNKSDLRSIGKKTTELQCKDDDACYARIEEWRINHECFFKGECFSGFRGVGYSKTVSNKNKNLICSICSSQTEITTAPETLESPSCKYCENKSDLRSIGKKTKDFQCKDEEACSARIDEWMTNQECFFKDECFSGCRGVGYSKTVSNKNKNLICSLCSS